MVYLKNNWASHQRPQKVKLNKFLFLFRKKDKEDLNENMEKRFYRKNKIRTNIYFIFTLKIKIIKNIVKKIIEVILKDKEKKRIKIVKSLKKLKKIKIKKIKIKKKGRAKNRYIQ